MPVGAGSTRDGVAGGTRSYKLIETSAIGVDRMKARVTEDCISCNLCVETCPEVFQTGDDDLAHAVVDVIPAELEGKTREAAEACPVEAIILEE
jgi:ferredoxin